MAKVNVDTRRTFYASFYPTHLLNSMSYEKTEKAWRKVLWEDPDPPGYFAFVAETIDKQVIGIAIAGPEKSADKQYLGELYVLYILPEYHHQGIGRRLVSAVAKRLLTKGITSMLIWVLASNPSRAFYEALGGIVVREKTVEIGDQMVNEVGYGWLDIHTITETE
jgi:GNAT superfamily N-acetyltransferase